MGGYRLAIACEGQGSPTVVLDSGMGDSMVTWSEVVPGVASFTRVCRYDRAGLGRSEEGPLPRTSERIVSELHSLLARAGVPPPYVLVGHSFGGMNVMLYAIEHGDETAGLVLVDATHDRFPSLEKELRNPAEMRSIERRFTSGPPAARSEFLSLGESAAELSAAGPLPPIPLIVITAGHRRDPPEIRMAWSELQRELADRAPGARQILADRSGHYIQYDQPDVVVDAIREVVEEIRQRLDAQYRIRENRVPASSPSAAGPRLCPSNPPPSRSQGAARPSPDRP